MPRPFLTEHIDAGRISRYVMRSPGERIGGNVLAWSRDDVANTMRGGPNVDAPRYLHVTISLSRDLQLDASSWMEVFQIAFRNLGLRIQSLPHLIWRHADTDIDHAHAMITLRDFVGRDVRLSGLGAGCDRADLEISEHLKLPRPHVPHYGRWPKPGLFHRRKDAAASRELSRAYAAMDECLRDQRPSNIYEFVNFLAPRLPDFGIGTRQIARGRVALELRLPNGATIRAKTISKDLTPHALESRFRLFRQVAGLRVWFSEMLLLYGSGEIYDQYLKKRNFRNVEAQGDVGRAPAQFQKNRGLSQGQDGQDRGRCGAPSGNAPDARDGGGGKAVLIERIFQEIEALRMQQYEMDKKLSEVLGLQQAMISALNLPVEPSGP